MRRPRLTYVVGVPGVGKSTVVNGYLARYDCELVPRPLAHLLYWHPAGDLVLAQLGAPHDEYPGTDRLSYGVLPLALEWCRTFPLGVVAEGDRLATRKFLGPASTTRDVTLVHAHARPETVEARRAARAGRQDPTWLSGRATKVARLVEWGRQALGVSVVDLDLDESVESQFELLRAVIG